MADEEEPNASEAGEAEPADEITEPMDEVPDQNFEEAAEEDEAAEVDEAAVVAEDTTAEETEAVLDIEGDLSPSPPPSEIGTIVSEVEKTIWDEFSPISKVQIDPGATVLESTVDGSYVSSLPVVPESETAYKPILYTFRVKDKGQRLANIVTAKAPPFYLQLDLSIPVIWCLFNSSNKNKLGISQLQWALYFLSSIICNEGVRPPDVQLCIDAIQDYLIDEYADMSQESVIYGPSHFGDFSLTKKKLPFSVTYDHMSKQCSTNLGRKDSGLMDSEFLRELENIKQIAGISSIDVTDSVSKDKALNILQDWRKEQVDKIQCELSMLFTIEDMLKTVDENSFDETQIETLFKKRDN